LFWHNVPGWASFFWAYDYLKDLTIGRNEEGFWRLTKMIVCAGSAGSFSCIICYPMDVIKCLIQCSYGPVPKMSQVARHLYITKGFKGFWWGLSAAMLNNFVLNATCMPVYDLLNEILIDEEWRNLD